MIITNKIKEAFPILNSIDDTLLDLHDLKTPLYIIAKRNEEFSIVVYVLTVNVPAIFQSLGKTLSNDMRLILDKTEAVLLDLNSIINDVTKIYAYKNSDYDIELETIFPLTPNDIYESKARDYIGIGIMGFNFEADELKDYKYYLYTADDRTDGYRFLPDGTFVELLEEIGVREPSNEVLASFHPVFADFDRTSSPCCDDCILGVNYIQRSNSTHGYAVVYGISNSVSEEMVDQKDIIKEKIKEKYLNTLK
jgi:hypothetical protein